MAESPALLVHHYQSSLSSIRSESPEQQNLQLDPSLADLPSPPILSPHFHNNYFIPAVSHSTAPSAAAAPSRSSAINKSGSMNKTLQTDMRDIFFPPSGQEQRPLPAPLSRDAHSSAQLVSVPDYNPWSFPLSQRNQQAVRPNQPVIAASHPPRHEQTSSHVVSFAPHHRLPHESFQIGTRIAPVETEGELPDVNHANVNQSSLLAPMTATASTGSIFPSAPPETPDLGNSKQVMRSSLFCPNYFTGSSQEDPHEFLRTFELWSTFNNFDEKSAISTFQLLLRGPAATWFKTIPKSAITNFQDVSKRFISRYTVLDKPWNEIGLLWGTRQLHNQTVHDYISHVQFKADRLQLSADTVFQIVLHGLLPGVKNCVLQKNVKNIDDLLQTATLFELANDSSPDPNAQVLQTLNEMKQQIDRLQIRPVSPMTPMQNSSKRVHFSDADQCYGQDLSHNDQKSFHAQPRTSSNAVNKNNYIDFNQRQNYTQKSQSFQPNFRSNFTATKLQNNFRSKFNSKGPQTSYNKNNQVGHFQSNGQSTCKNCGNSHKLSERCPAYGIQCRFCQRFNHFTRCCLKARSQSQ